MRNDNLNDYILLRTDSMKLLMLQDQMENISHILDWQQANQNVIKNPDEIVLSVANNEKMYINLSEKLTLLPHIPKTRYVYTTWKISPNIYWCWSEVKLINNIDLKKRPMPACISVPGMPVDGIFTLPDGTMALSCDIVSLMQYVTSTGEAHDSI